MSFDDGALFSCECSPPWLVARFPATQRIVSWSLNRPGFAGADTVAWLQVRNADLPVTVDPLRLLETRLAERGLAGAVGLMTARDVRYHHVETSSDGDFRVTAMVTLGLSNGVTTEALAGNAPVANGSAIGTINLLVAISAPLDDGALLETIAIAATARTAALLADDGRIVATGTDCIAVACPRGSAGADFAGLHTPVGRLVAETVYRATRTARSVWEASVTPDASP